MNPRRPVKKKPSAIRQLRRSTKTAFGFSSRRLGWATGDSAATSIERLGDPRYRGLQQTCEAWTLNFADYLRVNGLPTIEAAHLRELVYWEWFETTRQAVLDCKQQYVSQGFNPDETTAQHLAKNEASNRCDPWDEATKNDKQSPEDLGIRFN